MLLLLLLLLATATKRNTKQQTPCTFPSPFSHPSTDTQHTHTTQYTLSRNHAQWLKALSNAQALSKTRFSNRTHASRASCEATKSTGNLAFRRLSKPNRQRTLMHHRRCLLPHHLSCHSPIFFSSPPPSSSSTCVLYS